MKKIFLSIFLSFAIAANAADIYVAPNGDDTADGSKTTPLKSLRIALRQAREMRRLADTPLAEPVNIHLLSGTYNLHEPLYVRPEDSGTPLSPTVIIGHDASLSGGVSVTGWKIGRAHV